MPLYTDPRKDSLTGVRKRVMENKQLMQETKGEELVGSGDLLHRQKRKAKVNMLLLIFWICWGKEEKACSQVPQNYCQSIQEDDRCTDRKGSALGRSNCSAPVFSSWSLTSDLWGADKSYLCFSPAGQPVQQVPGVSVYTSLVCAAVTVRCSRHQALETNTLGSVLAPLFNWLCGL